MSAAQTFSYKNVNGNLKPIIPIEIQKDKQTIDVMALVDSGADISIFWGEVGEALGIDVRSGKKLEFGGIGTMKTKKQIGYLHKVGLKAGNTVINSEVAFSYDIDDSMAILGQNNFFACFDIRFSYKKKAVVLRRV